MPAGNRNVETAGQAGLQTARAIGMLTYRSFDTYAVNQTEKDRIKWILSKPIRISATRAKSFKNVLMLLVITCLTKAMDSHNIARGRAESIEAVLKALPQKALIIGIGSDLLCPSGELKKIANSMPNATFCEIQSLYGHDGFLIEYGQIAKHLLDWLA